MTDPTLNATDPIDDTDFPRIEPMDPDLPETPDHEQEVDDADQPEPEDVTVPPRGDG